MKSNIQIKFLSLDEMTDARNIDWRYEHVGIDNLGFADKKKNRVYVRAGLEPELTKYLIDHELEHLFEMEGTDEDEHGIRHKKKGGFMKIFAPIVGAILGSILLPGAGSFLGGSLGGLLGGPVGVGAGTMLGGVAGSSATGKPNWLGNTISGAAAGAGAGLGQAFSSTTGAGGSGIGGGGAGSFTGDVASNVGMRINAPALLGETAGRAGGQTFNIGQAAGTGLGGLFAGALGAGQSSQGGYGPSSGNQSFRMPDFSQQANANPSFSGWGEGIGLPDVGMMGGTGAESLTNSRGMGSLSKMPMNPGLGQAGLNLAGQSMGTGFGQGMNQMFQGQDQEQGLMDFNNDFGNLNF